MPPILICPRTSQESGVHQRRPRGIQFGDESIGAASKGCLECAWGGGETTRTRGSGDIDISCRVQCQLRKLEIFGEESGKNQP